MKIARSILIFTIFIGIIAFTINMVFGLNTIPFLTHHTIGTIEYYTFDFPTYFQQINAQIQNYSDLVLNLPTRQIIPDDIWNSVLVVIDYLILIINIILYPLRIGGYLVRIILTLMGINVVNPTNAIKWLVDFVNNLVSLAIPYI